MIPGYNHNVRYRDAIYHIQSEDSGVENPHVITHVFIGGNIIASRKLSYGDLLSAENYVAEVVVRMQAQHKGMLRDLISGTLDEQITLRSKNAAMLDGPAPLNIEASQAKESLMAPADQEREVPVLTTELGPLPEYAGVSPLRATLLDAERLQQAFDNKDDDFVDSIFGEDVISERPLDQVILAYLGES